MNTELMTGILKVSGPQLHPSGTEPIAFLRVQSSHGGHISRLGGTSSDLGGHGPEMPLPHGVGPVQPVAIFAWIAYIPRQNS